MARPMPNGNGKTCRAMNQERINEENFVKENGFCAHKGTNEKRAEKKEKKNRPSA